jgi:Trypsin-like peptidase domain
MPSAVLRAFESPLLPVVGEAEFEKSLLFEELADAPLRYISDPTTKALTANPGYDAASLTHVRGAVIRISGPEEGSAFIVNDPDGEQVIVTAAHVVAEHDPASVELTDFFGNRTTAYAGRYILEARGRLLTAAELDGPADIDLAVLRPEKPLGRTALRVGALAARGTWLDMVNYQHDAAFDAPHQYKGVVLTQRPGQSNYLATGMEPERVSEPLANTVVLRGASGGVAFNAQKGEVAGVSFFGSNLLLQPEDLALLNISFDRPMRGDDEESRLTPLLAHIVDPAYIRQAIATLPAR